VAILIDNPEFTANEIYEIQQTDPVEGAAAGASFGGIGVSNEPHQQLANRTALLRNQQLADMAAIAAAAATLAEFTGSLQTNGYIRIPIADVSRGAAVAIIQWGYFALAQDVITGGDPQFTVRWPIAFPNGILAPPLATNVYYQTGGANTAASVISYSATGATFVLDVPGKLILTYNETGEISNGFSWLAIGF